MTAHPRDVWIDVTGPRSKERRMTVTIREPGTPWPLRFHFLRLADEATGKVSTVNVGFEVGERFEDMASLDEEPPGVDPATIARIANQYAAYLSAAEAALVLNRGGLAEAIKTLRGPGRKPARLTDDFYRLVGADYEQRRASGTTSPLLDLAHAHHVDKGTASRWIKEARRRGYIEEVRDGE